MEEKLEEIMKELLGLSDDFELKDEMTPKDIETWDSLTHMKLVAEIEASFGIQFEFEEILNLSSVGNIKRTLHIND